MDKKLEFKRSLDSEKRLKANDTSLSNPLHSKALVGGSALNNYTKSTQRPSYDEDISGVLEVVRILNNLAPIRMPVYNFNLEELNGDHYYKPDGSLLLVREEDNDVIRDYYVKTPKEVCEYSISRILEHDRVTGRLRAKIEPISRKRSRLNTNITIFDLKVSNKYTIIQLSDDGIVNNISEFSGKGKSFQTLFRNIENFKPARYMEGKDNKDSGFEMIDCIFDFEGNIARIKKYCNKKEICIDYSEDKKNISVKTK